MPYQISGNGPWQYIDRIGAASYFAGRLQTGSWDDASATDQDKALAQATTLIDQLNFVGKKALKTQPLQFPRIYEKNKIVWNQAEVLYQEVEDTSESQLIPPAIINACAEVALKLLDDVDVNQEMSNVQLQRTNISTIHLQRNTDFVPDWVLAGIPSPIAWNMLRPFLLDPMTLELSRES